MESPALFYDSWLDALKDDVKAGGGSKEVGHALRPELEDPEAARKWLNDCLNETRRERMTQSQEFFIMRRARERRGFSAGLYWMCDETGFARPPALNPEDEKAQLQRQFIQAASAVQGIAARLERLEGKA